MVGQSWNDKRKARRAREAVESARLAEAVEGVAMERLARELTKPLVAAGECVVDRAPKIAEERRVAGLIRNDRVEREREEARCLAEIEVRDGVFVNLADSLVSPTPEWLTKGPVQTFTPRQPDGTVREVRTVRRVLTPIVKRLYLAGRINEEQFSACAWYRETHDVAGLEGRWSSSRYGETTGGGGGASGPMAMHEREVQARYDLRRARICIPPHLVRFFEEVVLRDVSLRNAKAQFACRHDRVYDHFRTAAEGVLAYCEAAQVELRATDALLAG